jgi:RNA polymerase sigma-70 factor, ECF subfamily
VEQGLIERARRGDAEAFEMLVQAGMPAIYRRALAILGTEADARDAAQETFVSAWRELPRLREPERYDAWLARIGVNACRMALRRRGRVREIPVPQFMIDPPAPDRIGSIAEAEAVRRAFRRLPVDQRTILVLHHVEERPVVEVAATLGVPLGTAKSRLAAARSALERALAEEDRP